MTTYDALGLPIFETSDKIAATSDGLRQDLNLIGATTGAAILAEGARAEGAAKWKRGTIPNGANVLEAHYGEGKEGQYASLLASSTATMSGLPQDLIDNPVAFTLTVKTLNNGVVLKINTYDVSGDAEYVCNSAPSTGTGWTPWKKFVFHTDLPEQKPQERGYKTVPLALTLPAGSSDTETVAAGSLRFPLRYGVPLYRGRLHVQNINDRGGQAYPGAVSFTGLWFGAGSHTSGAFTTTPVKVMNAFTTPADGSEYVGPWMNLNTAAGADYLASVGFTNTAGQQNTLSIGAAWRSTTPGNASVTAPSQTKGTGAPFSIWLEVEVPEDVPVVAELGSSGAAGYGSTLPILESTLSIYARRVGALPLHYAHSGSTLAIWDEASHHKWQKWQDYARPDALLLSLGSNDLYGSATLAETQAKTAEVLDIVRTLATSNVYATTVPPRATGDETTRRAYNTWLRTLPLGIRDVFDWAAAVSNDDEAVRPEFDADGIHTNTAGAQAKADAITRPVAEARATTGADVAAAVAGANTYTDGKDTANRAAWAAADTEKLTEAKAYTDTKTDGSVTKPILLYGTEDLFTLPSGRYRVASAQIAATLGMPTAGASRGFLEVKRSQGDALLSWEALSSADPSKWARQQSAGTWSTAWERTDGRNAVAASKTYTDAQDEAYRTTDRALWRAEDDGHQAAAEANAKTYTDGKDAANRTAWAAADAANLAAAKTYTDGEIALDRGRLTVGETKNAAQDDRLVNLDAVSPKVSNIALDTDGVPYYSPGSTQVHIIQDTDGTPYFVRFMSASLDTDGTPYFA